MRRQYWSSRRTRILEEPKDSKSFKSRSISTTWSIACGDVSKRRVAAMHQSDHQGRRRTGLLARAGSTGSGGNHQDDCPDPIELILYVSAESPRSAIAIEQIKSVLSQHKSLRVKLTICDLSKEPEGGNADGIAFTPTLVKRSPGPKTFILGHITNPELLLEMLEGCEDN